MKDDKISYLERIGAIVKIERDSRDMSQIDFYNFLFPGNKLLTENIKSKMNDIERAKRKTIDPDFLLALHEKCNLGMDYIFGYETEFPNHENENACAYTGLSIETIELLHGLALAQNEERPSLNVDMSDADYEHRCMLISNKQEAEWILSMIEVLLTQDNSTDGTYPNYKVLFDLYMMAVMKPNNLKGVVLGSVGEDAGLAQVSREYKELYMDSLYMNDSFGGFHQIDIERIHQQIWKETLITDIERFIPAAKKYYSKKHGDADKLSNKKLFEVT